MAQDTIERVFEDEDVSDAGLARESAEAWLRRQGPAAAAALATKEPGPDRDKATRRLYGYLARRGFRGDAVTAAIDHARSLAARTPDA